MPADEFKQSNCDKEHSRIDKELDRIKQHREEDLRDRDTSIAKLYEKLGQKEKDIYIAMQRNEEARSKRDQWLTGLIITTLIALCMNLIYMRMNDKKEHKEKQRIEHENRRHEKNVPE